MTEIIKSENFETTEDIFGTEQTPKQVSSNWFMTREGRRLLSKLGYEKDERGQFAGKLLHDYAATLKELVRQEMLEEMRKSIKNIETFYR